MFEKKLKIGNIIVEMKAHQRSNAINLKSEKRKKLLMNGSLEI
jgi:hypothetical protein